MTAKYIPFNTATDWTLNGKPPPDWRDEVDEDEDDNEDPDPTSPQLLKDITGIDEDDFDEDED